MWEEKIIKFVDCIGMNTRTIIAENRDWLLGGKNFEWRIRKDLNTGDLIMYRR